MGNSLQHRFFVLNRIVLRNCYRFLGPLNIYLQPGSHFCIKAGYHEGRLVEKFDDRQNADQWQRNVYESALACIKQNNGKSVIDVGCGSGFKLIDLFGNFETTGIELAETCDWLKLKYPGKKWMEFENTDPGQLQTDMIICSDVIEHVQNPDGLMDFLVKINFRWLVLSTPERNRVRGKTDFGPPENTSHYREWSDTEFKSYVSGWFAVKDQRISGDQSVSQILFCQPKE
jgi:SAM-dependent methyltransferase